jgi:4-amino-4-deoxy-L-arabinose transferase-like glycosyltransferase
MEDGLSHQRREGMERGIGALARRGLWVVLGVGLAARLPGLGTKPLWYDEAFSVLFSRAGLPAMISGTLSSSGASDAEIHPLLYYILLEGWTSLLGQQGLVVRLFSVVFGLVGIAVAYLLARRLFSERIALAAGLVFALSPFQIHYSQEVRMYSLLACLLLAATLCLLRAMEGAGWKAWMAFSILSVAAQYTHNLAAFYLVPLAMTPLWRRKWGDALRVGFAGGLALALYLPWLVVVGSQVARIEEKYWIARPGATELVTTLLEYCSSLPQPVWALPILLGACLLVLVAGCLALLRAVRARSADAGHALWLAYLAGAPAVLLFLVSQRLPVYLDRALIPSAGAFALWIGWALWSDHLSRPMAWTGRAALVVAVVVGLASYYTYRGFPYAPFAEAGRVLESSRGADEIVLHSNKLSALPGMYYTPGLPQAFVADPPATASDTLAPAAQDALGIAESATAAEAVGAARGVWLVMFSRETQDYLEAGGAAPPALSWLEANFVRQEERALGDLLLLHYRRAGDS